MPQENSRTLARQLDGFCLEIKRKDITIWLLRNCALAPFPKEDFAVDRNPKTFRVNVVSVSWEGRLPKKVKRPLSDNDAG